MAENHENLRYEYSEVASTLRHYASIQFAQLTAFIAIIGALLLADVSDRTPLARFLLAASAAVVGFAFAAMSLRVSDYWDKFAQRARDIEGILGMASYTTRPPVRLLTNRFAVMIVYFLLTVLAFVGPLARG